MSASEASASHYDGDAQMSPLAVYLRSTKTGTVTHAFSLPTYCNVQNGSYIIQYQHNQQDTVAGNKHSSSLCATQI